MNININIKEVLDLVNYGFVLIPTCSADHSGHSEAHTSHCKTPGKAPVLKGWNAVSTMTQTQVKDFYSKNPKFNWSVKLGGGIVAIDLDGVEAIAYFDEKVTEEDKKTVSFDTPSGGRRYLYRTGSQLRKASLDLGDGHCGIDFLGEGSLTVVPPSMGANGNAYRWILSYKECDIAPIPLSVLNMWKDAINVKKVTVSDSTKAKIATGQIEKIGEGGRNNFLTSEIGKLVRAMGNVSFETLYKCSESINNDYCEPPLEAESLRAMVLTFYNNDLETRTDKQCCVEDDDADAPSLVTKQFLAYLENKGTRLKYNNDRGMWYISEKGKAGWESMFDEGMNSKIKTYLDATRVTLNKISYRREILEALKCDCLSDQKHDASKLELGVNGSINQLGDSMDIRKGKGIHTICVNNGLVNMSEDSEVIPWNPNIHNHSYKLDVNWVGVKKEDKDFWEGKVAEWIPNIVSRKLLQEYVGYMLVPTVNMRAFMYLTGTGSNGKSLFMDAISGLFKGNTAIVDPVILQSNNFASSALIDKLLYLCPDADDMHFKKTGLIKQLTGGDAMRAEIKGGNSFSFKPIGKLLISTNKLPTSSDTSQGYADRLHIIHFDQRFKKDSRLKDEIECFANSNEGKCAILQWAIEGFRRYHIVNNGNFTESEQMDEMKDDMAVQSDNVYEFFKFEVVKTENTADKLQVPALYEAYKQWCFDSGVKACSRKTFGNKAGERGFEAKVCKLQNSKTGAKMSVRCYCGYTLNVFSENSNEIKESYKLCNKYIC